MARKPDNLPKHGLSAADVKHFRRCLKRLLATRAGRDALARWIKQAHQPRRRGGMPRKTSDNAIGPVMVHVAKLAGQRGMDETMVFAALVDALPTRLRSQSVKPDSEWRRIYNKNRRGKLPVLPPEVKAAIGVKRGFSEPALDICRQRLLFLLHAFINKFS